MPESELFWLKVSAIGQVAGALATFLAVAVSLYIALHGRRPRLKLKVGKRMFLGGGLPDRDVIMFSVTNTGERPVHVRSLGWQTGWLRWGPRGWKRQLAVQMFGELREGTEPPYEIQPGQEVSSYIDFDSFIGRIEERDREPFFFRRWAKLGVKRTSIWGHVYTADGHTITARVEKELAAAFHEAAVRAETAKEEGAH